MKSAFIRSRSGTVAGRAHELAERHEADRVHLRIDDDEVVEALRQPLLGAHEVDGVADRPVLGRDHDLALHQAPGGVLVVLERALDRRAVDVVEHPQDALLLGRLHVLGEIDDVVGLEVLHRPLEHRVGQLGDDLVADALLELGEHRALDVVAPERHQRRALGPADLLEQVGDVGLVEVVEQRDERRRGRPPRPRRARRRRSRGRARAPRARPRARAPPCATARPAASSSVPAMPASARRRSRGSGIAGRPYTLGRRGKARAGEIRAENPACSRPSPTRRAGLDRRPRMRPAARRPARGAAAIARARLTIDLDAIAANWRALDALSAPAVETAAVVKADAYGLGAARVGPALAAAGARTFFVALAEEGAALREALGPGPAIFVFAGLMPGDAALVRAPRPRPLPQQPRPGRRFRPRPRRPPLRASSSTAA